MNYLHYHNLLRWAVLVLGLWAILNAIGGMISKREYSRGDNMSSLLFMISCDIQLLLGLILYITNGWFSKLKSGMGIMKDPVARFFSVEHILMMVIAWVLIHIGRATSKNAETDLAKHKRILIYYGIAMILILAAIPWPFRDIFIDRPWVR